MKVEPKYRNVVSSDAKELSKIESHIFTMDNLKTNFKKEIRKDSKKIFVCTIEKRKKNQRTFYTFIKSFYNLFSKTKNELGINIFDDFIIGYAKIWIILDEIHIEQIGVIDTYRKKGIGHKILQFMIEELQEYNGLIYMHAQVDVMPFYEKMGFVKTGNIFEEAFIMHYKMILKNH